MREIEKQCGRRRTFAIISHPDAGKTTLTEKFLLYGGALQLAGAVASKKKDRATASDWMELEKQRGISVSSTALQFDYRDYVVNLVDTPGHQDFSEDTYRVLMAVDSVIMVLDAAKGLEAQTLKLFEVCRGRGIPIITFINKCDRPGKDPLALLDEIESQLGLAVVAENLPVHSKGEFVGLFDRRGRQLHLFERVVGGRYRAPVAVREASGGLEAEAGAVDSSDLAEVAEMDELLGGVAAVEDSAAIAGGTMTPVYFGSAVNNFGIQLLLDGFLRHAPGPRPRRVGDREVDPLDQRFSAFVFKIQANMDLRHRDRLVFLRVCSGRFSRDLRVVHAQSGRPLRLSFSHKLFGRERETEEEAWPGDILGITGHSGLEVGDTLTEDAAICFEPIPRFAPEAFIYLKNVDTGALKRFRRGLQQLLQEKVVQQFFPLDSDSQIPLLGAVGPLQFDVVRYRLEGEYSVETRVEETSWSVTRWVDEAVDIDALKSVYRGSSLLARDDLGRLCILFESEWSSDYFQRENPSLVLHKQPVGQSPTVC